MQPAVLKRTVEDALVVWRDSARRKPLLLRGARQVGKSFLVKQFGQKHFSKIFEFNFEKISSLKKIFERDLDAKRILSELELVVGCQLIAGEHLLFFDEIQECPPALKSLRYFFEDLPEYHVIAAGSLLEFIMDQISIPVGRVEFKYLYPMSFSEFLHATNRTSLVHWLPVLDEKISTNKTASDQLYHALKEYCIVGGMPEAVAVFVETGSYIKSCEVLDSLLLAFRDDIHKYTSGAKQIGNIEQTLQAVCKHLGKQIKYSTLHPEDDYKRTKTSLELLEKAMLIHIVPSVNPNGLPLGAEASTKYFKYLFLDIGLAQRLAGYDLSVYPGAEDLLSVYNGQMAEQLVGQELLCETGAGSELHRLYCWIRTEKSSTAEVDYVIVRKGEIIPIEVKSGKGGKLKSLQFFLKAYPNVRRGICIQHRQDVLNQDQIHYYPLFSIL